jgi:hypothetical protein
MLSLCPPPPRTSYRAVCRNCNAYPSSRLSRSFDGYDASWGETSSPVAPPFPRLRYDGVIAMPTLKPRPSNAYYLSLLDRQSSTPASGHLTPKRTHGTQILPARPELPRLSPNEQDCSQTRATPSNVHLAPKRTAEKHALRSRPLPTRLSLEALDCNRAPLGLSLSLDDNDASSERSAERFHSGILSCYKSPSPRKRSVVTKLIYGGKSKTTKSPSLSRAARMARSS